MKQIIYFLIFNFLLGITNITLANFVANKDYIVIAQAVNTDTKDKIEVREIFWYYCPHCFRTRSITEKWAQTLPSSVEFIKQPAIISGQWGQAAKFYYTLEYLNKTNELHSTLFNAIHVYKESFLDDDDFIDWLVEQDVNEKLAREAFNSFATHLNVNKAKINSIKYGINSVPAIVVNGKYLVNSSAQNNIYAVTEFLIEKELKLK